MSSFWICYNLIVSDMKNWRIEDCSFLLESIYEVLQMANGKKKKGEKMHIISWTISGLGWDLPILKLYYLSPPEWQPSVLTIELLRNHKAQARIKLPSCVLAHSETDVFW